MKELFYRFSSNERTGHNKNYLLPNFQTSIPDEPKKTFWKKDFTTIM